MSTQLGWRGEGLVVALHIHINNLLYNMCLCCPQHHLPCMSSSFLQLWQQCAALLRPVVVVVDGGEWGACKSHLHTQCWCTRRWCERCCCCWLLCEMRGCVCNVHIYNCTAWPTRAVAGPAVQQYMHYHRWPCIWRGSISHCLVGCGVACTAPHSSPASTLCAAGRVASCFPAP